MALPELLAPRSLLRRRLVGFGPDPTKGTARSLAPPRSFLRRRLFCSGQSPTVTEVSTRDAAAQEGLPPRTALTAAASPPSIFLRRKLVGLGPTQ